MHVRQLLYCWVTSLALFVFIANTDVCIWCEHPCALMCVWWWEDNLLSLLFLFFYEITSVSINLSGLYIANVLPAMYGKPTPHFTFWDSISLSYLGCPWTSLIILAGFEFGSPPDSASGVTEIMGLYSIRACKNLTTLPLCFLIETIILHVLKESIPPTRSETLHVPQEIKYSQTGG